MDSQLTGCVAPHFLVHSVPLHPRPETPMLRFLFAWIAMLIPTVSFSAERPTAVPGKAGRSVTIAAHGIVATSHPLAAQVGLDVLKKGGNAVDAAIATSAAMGLMEPM